MSKRSKYSLKPILFFLLMLYPVLPVNYYISVFSYSNICSILIVVLYFCEYCKVRVVNVFKYDSMFWIYLIIYAIFAFITAGVSNAVSWVVTEIFVSVVIIQLASSYRDFLKMIDGILYISIFISLIGIVESLSRTYLIQGSLMQGWSDSLRYGFLRCTGPFGHPINFGIFQAIAALLAFYRLNLNITIKQKYCFIVTYSLAIVSLLMSMSRLPILFFVVAQVCLFLQMTKKQIIKYICIAVLAVFCASCILEVLGVGVFRMIGDFFVTFLNMLGFELTSSDTAISFGNRFDLYSWVINDVGENFLFGKGVKAEFKYIMNEQVTKTSIEVHYLYIFFKCGLVGMVSLIVSYISTIFFFGRRIKVKYDPEGALSFLKVLFIILLGYYVCMFGVQETDTARIYCEMIALGIAYYRICRNERINKRRQNMCMV